MDAVSNTPFQRASLDRLTAVGGELHLPTLVLFINDFNPNADTVFADLVSASFDGYAAVAAVAFGPAGIDSSGNVLIVAPSSTFLCTGATDLTQVVYGWALVDAGLTTYYLGARLDAPVPINQVGKFVTVQPAVGYGA